MTTRQGICDTCGRLVLAERVTKPIAAVFGVACPVCLQPSVAVERQIAADREAVADALRPVIDRAARRLVRLIHVLADINQRPWQTKRPGDRR